MDSQSLTNVLGILRLIKSQRSSSISTLDFLRSVAGPQANNIAILKIAEYFIDQVEIAKVVIDNSQLSDEAKAGVAQYLDALSRQFSLENMAGSISGIHASSSGAISNFVILIEAYRLPKAIETPEEATSLINEIEETIGLFDAEGIDPVVKAVSQKHMRILIKLLNSIPLVGLEPALTEYFSLVTKLRRADVGSTDTAHEKVKPIWDRIETWGRRLGSLDKIVNVGTKFVEKSDDVVGFLDHII